MLPSDFTDPFGLEKLTRSTSIGFDDIIRRLSTIGSTTVPPMGFPPYNIKKTGENTYILEMAVAGFGKQDIEITIENDVLSIRGTMSSSSDENSFIHKGIAERNFHRRFTLSDTVQVKSSSLANGMLKVFLERLIPETKKAKTIKID